MSCLYGFSGNIVRESGINWDGIIFNQLLWLCGLQVVPWCFDYAFLPSPLIIIIFYLLFMWSVIMANLLASQDLIGKRKEERQLFQDSIKTIRFAWKKYMGPYAALKPNDEFELETFMDDLKLVVEDFQYDENLLEFKFLEIKEPVYDVNDMVE